MGYRTIRIAIMTLVCVLVAATAFAQGSRQFADLVEGEPTIWDNERITFTKPDGADPGVAENQDRITDSVWITRGNEGGQIYNAVEQDTYVKETSPIGTLWAVGTTENLEGLTFAPFRAAVTKPKEVVGKDLVLFIEEEQIFIDVRFLSWSQGKEGGFSYERSTP